MHKVAVIIPVYQKNLSDDEQLSLYHARKYLGAHQVLFMAPDKYQFPTEIGLKKTDRVEYFPHEHFLSVKNYSSLLLTPAFYERFLEHEYIFIYQLDGLVFKDDLEKWCDYGYSYVGAPWRYSLVSLATHPNWKFLNIVGNGGVSLRKVRDHINILHKFEQHACTSTTLKEFFIKLVSLQTHSQWLQSNPTSYPFNEDGFWSLEAPKYSSEFSIAPVEIASQFALEKYPEYFSNKYNNGLLPFAAHAWAKYDRGWWEARLFTS